MKRKLITTILAVFLSISFIGASLAMETGNKRKGKYTYRKVYKACFERGEVSAAKPTLNPDAHSQAGLQCLHFGVLQARKGWLTRADVINCLPLGEVEEALAVKR